VLFSSGIEPWHDWLLFEGPPEARVLLNDFEKGSWSYLILASRGVQKREDVIERHIALNGVRRREDITAMVLKDRKKSRLYGTIGVGWNANARLMISLRVMGRYPLR
jgi:hypothetical protein